MAIVLLISGVLSGLVNFFVNYLELPFPKIGTEDNDWPKLKTIGVALVGYLIVGITGSFLTPLIGALVGGLKGLEDTNNKSYNYILFGYGIVFGYSTTRILLSLLDSILKRLPKIEYNVNKILNERSSKKYVSFSFDINETAQDIIVICEANFEANKDNCSGFVKAVAANFSVVLTGQADNIVDQIQQNGWTILNDGIEAKEKADNGWLVIAGLKSFANVPPQSNGHVVVIVSGELAHQKYPVGYWGKLGGIGEKNKTINYAWNKDSRDKVIYSGRHV